MNKCALGIWFTRFITEYQERIQSSQYLHTLPLQPILVLTLQLLKFCHHPVGPVCIRKSYVFTVRIMHKPLRRRRVQNAKFRNFTKGDIYLHQWT